MEKQPKKIGRPQKQDDAIVKLEAVIESQQGIARNELISRLGIDSATLSRLVKRARYMGDVIYCAGGGSHVRFYTHDFAVKMAWCFPEVKSKLIGDTSLRHNAEEKEVVELARRVYAMLKNSGVSVEAYYPQQECSKRMPIEQCSAMTFERKIGSIFLDSVAG